MKKTFWLFFFLTFQIFFLPDILNCEFRVLVVPLGWQSVILGVGAKRLPIHLLKKQSNWVFKCWTKNSKSVIKYLNFFIFCPILSLDIFDLTDLTFKTFTNIETKTDYVLSVILTKNKCIILYNKCF